MILVVSSLLYVQTFVVGLNVQKNKRVFGRMNFLRMCAYGTERVAG